LLSKQKQIGQLRKAILTAMREYGLKRTLINTARSSNHIASGKFISLLRKADDDVFSVRNTSFSNEGLLETFSIIFDLKAMLGEEYFYYFETLDDEITVNRDWRMNPGASRINRWITRKISNGTWKGSTTVFSGGRTLDLYNEKNRMRLAYAIAKTIKSNDYIQSTGGYSYELRVALGEIIDFALDDFLNLVNINISDEIEIILNDIF
jgi:hypothetical protein